MMNNKENNSVLEHMKHLMNYGINEAKTPEYNTVEYDKIGADNKRYGIVREGTKYYIKVAEPNAAVIAENFNYIGGFRNRKANEYNSFANAQKNFDLKMMSIQEAVGVESAKKVIAESWNSNINNEYTTEAGEKMMQEIARQRQIMENVNAIYAKKPVVMEKVSECGTPFCEDPDKEYKETTKNNIKGGPATTGNAKKANKGYKEASLKNTEIKESAETLAWNREKPDYMDTTHGTEVGDSTPFDAEEGRQIDNNKQVTKTGELENGTVAECKCGKKDCPECGKKELKESDAMIDNDDDQNKPEVGTNERGDDTPFDAEEGRQIDEAIEDIETTEDVEDADADDEDGVPFPEVEDEVEDIDDEDEGAEDEDEDSEVEYELETDDDEDTEMRLQSLENLVRAIADKLDVSEADEPLNNYEDEPLYDDEDETDDEDDFSVVESASFRRLRKQGRINEDKLDVFGKHPAYQKKVMELPTSKHNEKEGYYDMNDDSAKSEEPYGRSIGKGKPFEVNPETIENAIAESVIKVLKKGRR